MVEVFPSETKRVVAAVQLVVEAEISLVELWLNFAAKAGVAQKRVRARMIEVKNFTPMILAVFLNLLYMAKRREAEASRRLRGRAGRWIKRAPGLTSCEAGPGPGAPRQSCWLAAAERC